MPFYDVICQTCRQEQRDVFATMDESVPCLACGGPTEHLWTISPAIAPDQWPNGQVIENLGHEPVTVYSRSELARLAAARGLQPFVRHVTGSKETTDWSARMDPQTLENARILVSRASEVRSDPVDVPCDTFTMRIRRV